MKHLSLIALLALSLSAFGHQHEDHEEMDFDTMKTKALEHIDKRIATMNEHKSCVSAAKAKEDLKKCREQMKEKRKAMKEGMKEKMKEHKEKKGKKK